MSIHRREFLKATTAGATGLILGGRAIRAYAAWPASGTVAINPNISNMRVVGCVDPSMIKSKPTAMTFAAENAVVDAVRVAANMDAMAMHLANTTTADAAWSTIFRSSKPWASTLVAIKVNALEPKNMARLAVIQKLVAVLRKLGVQPANIIIYDGNGTYAAGISNYTSHFSLSDAAKIPAVVSNYNSALGGKASAALPDGSSATCTAHIANGKVDILINIANNKGHTLFGGSTLCMKNHFGTFAPNHTNLASYVFKINKSDAIIGGSPVRQQLCFIDSLFANKASNAGTPEAMPGYLVMGTFAPAVDYLTVKKVREEVLRCTHDSATVKAFLTSFGYTTNDPEWVLVPPAEDAPADGGTDAPAHDAGTAGIDAGADTPLVDSGVVDSGAATRRDAGPDAGEKGGKDGGVGGNGSHDTASVGEVSDSALGCGCAPSAGRQDVGAAMLAIGAMLVAQVRRLFRGRSALDGPRSADVEEAVTRDRE